MLKRLSFWVIGLILILQSCANRGNPSGGIIDEDPPMILQMTPENYSVNFSAKEIIIVFDEYVKLKNLQQQLIISPPMNTQPEILPMGTASKKLTIRLIDSLLPETTYALSFGESIIDNNEGNPYPFFKYVFSTGEYIDSLKVSGVAINSENREPKSIIAVMLYEIDSTYKDSIVYQKKPKYVSQTTDSTSGFLIENVKSGSYKLIALEEESRDYTYQQGKDYIGFVEKEISLPTEESFVLNLFKEDVEFKPKKVKQMTNNKLVFGFEGPGKKMHISLISKVDSSFRSRITLDQKTDSLYYWYRSSTPYDSLQFVTSHLSLKDSSTVQLRDIKRDSLIVTSRPQSSINFNEQLILTANLPLVKVDDTLINLVDQDTLPVLFQFKIDSLANEVIFDFEKKPSNNYVFKAFPGAFTDFFDTVNDTLNFRLRTKSLDDYGNLRINLKNASYPAILQLVDRSGDIKRETYVTQAGPVDFQFLNPGIYYLRLIADTNKNGIYDSGRFLERRQGERISHYPESLDIRAGWDEIIEFTLD
jgi:hypothetical protein